MREEIILASGSPRRAQLLELIGVPFRVMKTDEPEETDTEDPAETVKELSRRKAMAAARRGARGIILGADTIVVLEGEILGKPSGPGEAREMLTRLQGRAHQVFTGVTLLLCGSGRGEEAVICRSESFACETVVHVHEMSPEEIERYVATGEPFDKAGGYGIQGPFAAFVDRIEGDYQNVVGLPAAAVYQKLKAFSGELPESGPSGGEL